MGTRKPAVYTQLEEQEWTPTNAGKKLGGSVGAVLSRLEDRGLVRYKGRYWAIGDDDRLASYAAQTTASSVSTTDDYYGQE